MGTFTHFVSGYEVVIFFKLSFFQLNIVADGCRLSKTGIVDLGETFD